MLSLEHLSLRLGADDDSPKLVSDVSAKFQRGEFVAIIGPSGCGKSTLLKMIAGISPGDEEGVIRWDGRDLSEEDFKPSEIGYVPQFSIAYDELTVEESVDYSARLRVANLSAEDREAMVVRLLEEVGMSEFHERRVKVLSGGQKRRLALAMELVSSPPILLCDEVTSGLDPQSEEEIVALLRRVARDGNRLVLSVTHSLKDFECYDKVLVLTKGVVAYEGKPEYLSHYFRVDDPNLVYKQLETRDAEGWQGSWKKHAVAFLQSVEKGSPEIEKIDPKVKLIPCPECGTPCDEHIKYCRECGCRIVPAEESSEDGKNDDNFSPGIFSQFATLVDRRFTIFFRSHGQVRLQILFIIVLPITVAIFGWNGLPQIRNLGMGLDLNLIEQLTQARDFLVQASKVGSQQLLVLFLVNAAMTSVCLAISSFMNSAEQASLASIYLVGFQLPLSGAVLALPTWLGPLIRPFIVAYWSWSGMLQTLRGERYYDIVSMVIQTSLSASNVCLSVLGVHLVLGILMTAQGCSRTRME